jgi:predicted MFS family arabinose efflux permease
VEHPRLALAALLALGAAAFCFVTAENMPVGLLGVIASSLHSSVSAVGLLVTAYAAVVVVSSAPLTRLTTRWPRRPVICALVSAFSLTTLASSVAGNYWWLLGTRVLTALAQALFWSIVSVTAVSLFPARVRGKAVAGVLGGSSVAVVLGVPAATWIGQQGGWRLPFLVLSGLGAAIGVAIAFLLPGYHPAKTHAGTGTRPSRRRYRLLILTTILQVTGSFTAYTYISDFLTHVARLPAHDVAGVLLVAGAGGTLGLVAAGALFDRHPKVVSLLPEALLACALLGLYAFGTSHGAALLGEILASVGLSTFVVTNQNTVLIVAPGSTDVASAWLSASFNVGIASGSLAGSLAVTAFGVRATTLAGGLLASGALVAVLIDHLTPDERRPAVPGAPGLPAFNGQPRPAAQPSNGTKARASQVPR